MVERKRKALPSRQAVINPQNEIVVEKTLSRALPPTAPQQPATPKSAELPPPKAPTEKTSATPAAQPTAPEPEATKAPIRVYIPAGSKLNTELGEIEALFATRKIKITPTNILASALEEHEEALIKTLKRLYRS